MDTKQQQRQATPAGGPPGRRSKTGLGWWPGAIATAAVVAVIAATIWAVAPGEGSFDPTKAAPAPVTPSAGSDVGAPPAGWTLYLWDPSTGEVRMLFRAPNQITGAELSPKGRRVVYARQDTDGIRQIYLLTPAGTERQMTTLEGGAFDPSWSPDGRQIAFAGSADGADSDIFVVQADGLRVARLVGTPRDDGNPSWSSDGTRLAFESDPDYWRAHGRGIWHGIWVASVRTPHERTRITSLDLGWGSVEPVWSPGGRWIAYLRFTTGTINGQHARELWRVRPDGSRMQRISGSLAFGGQTHEPTWSPDGRMIALSRGDDLRVVLLGERTGHVRTLFTGSGSGWLQTSWSREGILLEMPTADPAPSPGPAPPTFQVQSNEGIDATITMGPGVGCKLDVDNPISAGVLKLELVNDSRLDGYFRIVRLNASRSFSRIHKNAEQYYFGRPRVRLGPWERSVWSSKRISAGGWAVVCSKDLIPASNGFAVRPVGVAGPIEIEA